MEDSLERIASLAQQVGRLTAEKSQLQHQLDMWKGVYTSPVEHTQWMLQTLLDRLNDADAYLLDIDDVLDHIVNALDALGSVRYGMAYDSED